MASRFSIRHLSRARVAQVCGESALCAQVVPLLGWIGGGWWALDVMNVFVPHCGAFALVALPAAAYARRPRTTAALALAAAWAIARCWPEHAHPAPAGEVPVKVLIANVHTANTDHARILDLVRAEEPDVVGLLEVNQRWVTALGELRAEWPHGVDRPREDNFGISVYSRMPLGDLRVEALAAGVPTVIAGLHGARLVVTHPLPPVGAEYSRLRDRQLAAIAELRDHRTIVAGDLNAAPWSRAFPGDQPGFRPVTWPARVPAILRIAIDHVLVGRDVRLERLRVGPDVGSDHRPLLADLVVPPS